MKHIFYSFLISISFLSVSFSQSDSKEKLLLIRCDDIGMSHSVNIAVKELIDAGSKVFNFCNGSMPLV